MHGAGVVHGPTAPLESLPVVPGPAPLIPDGLADGLGREGQSATLEGRTHEDDVGQEVVREEALGDPLRADEDGALVPGAVGDRPLQSTELGPAESVCSIPAVGVTAVSTTARVRPGSTRSR